MTKKWGIITIEDQPMNTIALSSAGWFDQSGKLIISALIAAAIGLLLALIGL